MNRILINATQSEEIRVAHIRELDKKNKLYDLDIEYLGREQKKANIYKGKISRIEPSLEAVFINYGAERHGFLPFKEIEPSYLKHSDRQHIKHALRIDQELMIQIEKEERGNKGAALTTYISLPGSYLVLMPNNPSAGGISRRIEGDERKEMYELISQLNVPQGMGIIFRTAGVGRELEELQADLNLLLKQWNAIKQAFQEKAAPFLIFQEGDLIYRTIRDYLRHDIEEILIDDPNAYEKARNYAQQLCPAFEERIKRYTVTDPLFSHFAIEEAVESAFQREVRLNSGGTIIIDKAEALVAIDINSGRSTKNEDIEETAVKTNLEAAEAIINQLRFRDLGGLIVIDFIDMVSEDNKRKVENCLREAAKKDRARIQLGRISSFGLLEMSRQRLRPSLGKGNETTCTHCLGQGTVRSVESLSLSIIRALEKEALKSGSRQIRVETTVEVATYLFNEKRKAIYQIEQASQASLLFIPNPYWQNFQFKISRLNAEEITAIRENGSYTNIVENKPPGALPYSSPLKTETPVVKSVFPSSVSKKTSSNSLFNFLTNWLKQLIKKTKKSSIPISSKSNQAPPTINTFHHRNTHDRRYPNKSNRGNYRNNQRRENTKNWDNSSANTFSNPPRSSSFENKETAKMDNESRNVFQPHPEAARPLLINTDGTTTNKRRNENPMPARNSQREGEIRRPRQPRPIRESRKSNVELSDSGRAGNHEIETTVTSQENNRSPVPLATRNQNRSPQTQESQEFSHASALSEKDSSSTIKNPRRKRAPVHKHPTSSTSSVQESTTKKIEESNQLEVPRHNFSPERQVNIPQKSEYQNPPVSSDSSTITTPGTSTTSINPPLRPRHNMVRRFGGEPKIRRRSYTDSHNQ